MKNKLPKLSDLVQLARRWGLRGLGRLRKNEVGKLLARVLPEKSARELVTLGKKLGLDGLSGLKKSELVERLRGQLGRLSPARNLRGLATTVGAVISAGSTKGAPGGETRRRPVGGGNLELVAREPNWLYAWWEFDRETTRKLGKPGVVPVLRVVVVEADGSERQVARVDLPLHARSWHLRVEQSGVRYRALLEIRRSGGGSQTVLVSRVVSTPADFPTDRLATQSADASGKLESLPAAASTAAEKLNRLSKPSSAGGPPGSPQVSSLPSSR